jgi:hypothetical protein
MSKTRSLGLIGLLLILQFVQSAVAATLAGSANDAQTAVMTRALQAFDGTGVVPKRGPLVKLGFDLIEVYFEHQDYLAGGGPRGRGTDFRPSNKLIRAQQDFVVIDAVAIGSAVELQDQLVALGMIESAVFGRYVSGLIPIAALVQVAALSTLRLARPAMARARSGLVTSQGDAALAADVARMNFGVDGTGITVGSLSDSFDCLGQRL